MIMSSTRVLMTRPVRMCCSYWQTTTTARIRLRATIGGPSYSVCWTTRWETPHPKAWMQQTPCLGSFFSTQPKQDKKQQQQQTNKDPPPLVRPQALMEQLQSPPNLITLARLAATPGIAYMIVHPPYGSYSYAIAACAIAAASDGLDGYLAKTYQMQTPVGSFLDPLADKILINAVAVSLWASASSTLPGPLVGLWLVKDVSLILGTGYVLFQSTGHYNFLYLSSIATHLPVHPTPLAKWNTGLQFLCVGLALTELIVLSSSSSSMTILDWLPSIKMGLCWLTGATTLGSGISYARRARVEWKASPNPPPPKP